MKRLRVEVCNTVSYWGPNRVRVGRDDKSKLHYA